MKMFKVTKKFPISVQYKTPLWDNDSKLYTNELENKSLQVGIVFTPKKLTENSFELHDSKGKICTYYFKENSLLDYCEVFNGANSIEEVIKHFGTENILEVEELTN